MIPESRKRSQSSERIQTIIINICLEKLCESIVNEHLVNHCEKLNLFGDQQSAYKSGRCTTEGLLTLTEKTTTSLKWKGATASALLDVEQAHHGTKVSYKGKLRLNTMVDHKTDWQLPK